MNELPENPMTATFVLMEAPGNPHVFAFGCAFPGGLRFTVHSEHAAHHQLDPKLCKDYAAEVLRECIARGRMDVAHSTNWASVAAAIQRLITDWNGKRQVPQGGVQ